MLQITHHTLPFIRWSMSPAMRQETERSGFPSCVWSRTSISTAYQNVTISYSDGQDGH